MNTYSLARGSSTGYHGHALVWCGTSRASFHPTLPTCLRLCDEIPSRARSRRSNRHLSFSSYPRGIVLSLKVSFHAIHTQSFARHLGYIWPPSTVAIFGVRVQSPLDSTCFYCWRVLWISSWDSKRCELKTLV